MIQAQGEKIRKWDEINGIQEPEHGKDETPQEQRNGPMIAPGAAKEQDYLKNTEEQKEDDYNSIDGILNNGSKPNEDEERKVRERDSVMEKIREQEKRKRSAPPEYPLRDHDPLCPERNRC